MAKKLTLLRNIPERIGYLILLYLHQQLSPLQRQELDKWILEEDENELTFDEAINFEKGSDDGL